VARARAPHQDSSAPPRSDRRPPPQAPGLLAEVLAHSGDMRIPLGLPFDPEPQLTAAALDFLTGPLPLGLVPLGTPAGDSLASHRHRPNVG
jgi:hypothetical protein